MRLATKSRVRVLDFDIECRPIAWYAGDFVTKQPTAIAWKLVGARGRPEVALVGESDRSSLVLDEEAAMIEAFRVAFDAADVVTGHYVRGFDLPTIDGACMRLGLELLGPKLVQDTKTDLVRAQGISKSQENLGAMFELKHPKVGMNTALWGRGNMLLPDGIALTRKRVVGDVQQHLELRAEMLARGVLGPPRPWGDRTPERSYQP